MSDMLVKLYELPPISPVIEEQRAKGIEIRRALVPEKSFIIEWVAKHFSILWRNECEVAFSYQPPTCFIAVESEQLIGFACHETTHKNFFGPTGVAESARGQGVGRALLLACLHDMHALGYGYAIIGAAGPHDFYAKTVGAIPIAGSSPGVYRGMLRQEQK